MKKIKLDQLDKHILFELDKNSRTPTTTLAKKLERSRETIVYRINNLIKKGVIKKFVTMINPAKLGYTIFRVYAQIENKKEERERMINNLKKSQNIWWIAECSGVWDIIFLFFTKNASTFYDLKNKMLVEYRNLVIKDIVGVHVDTYQFAKKYLIDNEYSCDLIGGPPVYNEIDEVDKKILNILSNNARIPLTELAKNVNSAEQTVRNKMKNMEEKGIIVKYCCFLDLSKIGLAFFKANIYFSILNTKRELAFIEYLKIHPQARYYIRSVAPWGAEVEFVAENLNDFRGIMDKIKDDFSDIIKHYEFVLISWEDWLPGGIFNKNNKS